MKGPLPTLLAFVALVLGIITLTKIADNVKMAEPPGSVFWMIKQRVVSCSMDQITLQDKQGSQTQLQKDASWPDCAEFQGGEQVDFQLSRGEKVHFVKRQKSDWWR